MTAVSPDVWKRLEAATTAEATLTSRYASDETDLLIAGIDSQKRRHFLVELVPTDVDVREVTNRGIAVSVREWSLIDGPLKFYADIVCLEQGADEMFNVLGGELARRLSFGTESASQVVNRVLSKWQRFWSESSSSALSKEAQLGLVGELSFLSEWLFPQLSKLESVLRWRGPYGSRHDFEWSDGSVEVKTTASSRGPVHRIRSIEQLAPPENGNLMLLSIQVREEQGGAVTLPDLVTSCFSELKDEPTALIRFEEALFAVGYFTAHESEYSKLRLRIRSQRLYKVTSEFPRLTIDNFKNGMPSGIEEIVYEINLSGFDHLAIAQNPTEFHL